eukprot:CAMPEP_0194363224 /NCGR_PEP_ID=MMETSP0174-20130528/11086_1 /TAXON_ID=216777 /ORGANISM="Proboscia alata, Strain PI-D3" /LENGTH=659 /DNA_ID=CAMNT_0039136575 /DNA_START=204 /DNA_END=2183 /DNA_ORIENTATION=-
MKMNVGFTGSDSRSCPKFTFSSMSNSSLTSCENWTLTKNPKLQTNADKKNRKTPYVPVCSNSTIISNILGNSNSVQKLNSSLAPDSSESQDDRKLNVTSMQYLHEEGNRSLDQLPYNKTVGAKMIIEGNASEEIKNSLLIASSAAELRTMLERTLPAFNFVNTNAMKSGKKRQRSTDTNMSRYRTNGRLFETETLDVTSSRPRMSLSQTYHPEAAVRLTSSDMSIPITRHFTFDPVNIIGHGASSTVWAAHRIQDNKSFAVKCIQKHKILHNYKQLDEYILLSKLQDGLYHHPHIIQFETCYENATEVYLVLEFAKGGELFDRIKSVGPYNEERARLVVWKLLKALKYLHQMNIVHRDVKPENILLMSDCGDGTDVKLSDFGSARFLGKKGEICEGVQHKTLSDDQAMERKMVKVNNDSSLNNSGKLNAKALSPCSENKRTFYQASAASSSLSPLRLPQYGKTTIPRIRDRAYSNIGSDYYRAPEISSGLGYGTSVDLYSLGVTAYILLSGCPFPLTLSHGVTNDSDRKELYQQGSAWDSVSNVAKSFLLQLLKCDPEERMTANTALEHPWMLNMAVAVEKNFPSSKEFGSSSVVMETPSLQEYSSLSSSTTPIVRQMHRSQKPTQKSSVAMGLVRPNMFVNRLIASNALYPIATVTPR